MQIAHRHVTNRRNKQDRNCTGTLLPNKYRRFCCCPELNAIPFLIKSALSIAALLVVATQSLCAFENRIAVATLLTNGDLRITYAGFGSHQYALERAETLIPPVVWTAIITNTADL